jgi:hypothetical protein
MTFNDFERTLGERLAANFGGNDPDARYYFDVDSCDSFLGQQLTVVVRGQAYCKCRVKTEMGRSVVSDVEWMIPVPVAVPEPGQPCLAFKGINKFLRKREGAL